jgi:hypothetical protein
MDVQKAFGRRRVVAGLVGGALAGVVGLRSARAQGQGDEHKARPRETGDTPSNPPPLNEPAPPAVPPGTFERPETVEPKGKQPVTGPPGEPI